MKVRCVRPLRSSNDPAPPGSGVTVGHTYNVIEMQVRGARATLRVIDDDGQPTMWAVDGFEVSDSKLPSNWHVKFDEDGTITLSPRELQAARFWWSYFEGDDQARSQFEAAITQADGGS